MLTNRHATEADKACLLAHDWHFGVLRETPPPPTHTHSTNQPPLPPADLAAEVASQPLLPQLRAFRRPLLVLGPPRWCAEARAMFPAGTQVSLKRGVRDDKVRVGWTIGPCPPAAAAPTPHPSPPTRPPPLPLPSCRLQLPTLNIRKVAALVEDVEAFASRTLAEYDAYLHSTRAVTEAATVGGAASPARPGSMLSVRSTDTGGHAGSAGATQVNSPALLPAGLNFGVRYGSVSLALTSSAHGSVG